MKHPQRQHFVDRVPSSGYHVLHGAARLVRGRRRRWLKIAASWPWAKAVTAAWKQISALPQAP
jgi:hypothetical protein